MIYSHHAAIVAQRAYPVHPEDADDLDEVFCYATLAMSIYSHPSWQGHGGAVLSAGDRIVNINLARAAVVAPRPLGHRYGK